MNLRPGQIAILAAGVILVIFSFLTFYDVGGAEADTLDSQCEEIADTDRSDIPDDFQDEFDQAVSACGLLDGTTAWSSQFGLPLFTWPALIGLAVAGIVAADAFTNFDPPEVAGFSAPQLLTGLAFAGALMMVGFLIMGTEEGQTFGIGFWFMLLGSLALLAGTVMELLQGPAGSVRTADGPTTFGTPPGPGGGFDQPGPGGFNPPGPPGPPGPPQPPGPDPNAF
jgi:hypothetical protein